MKRLVWLAAVVFVAQACMWRVRDVRAGDVPSADGPPEPARVHHALEIPGLAPRRAEPSRYRIDWGFIAALEGTLARRGYVPTRKGKVLGRSGVTVASGFDLGQHGELDLHRMGIGEPLLTKLRPYLRRKGTAARRLLDERPLRLTERECATLNRAKRLDTVRKIERAYDRGRSPRVPSFARLTPAQQTVIASIATQYGTRLDRKTPRFWYHVLAGDFASARDELRSFGDGYPTRRNREADLLEG